MGGSLDPIVRSVVVECTVAEAFELWTTRIHVWWPVGRISASEQDTSRVIMEPREGGRLYERTKEGEEVDWGRIVQWEPPGRIVYEWFLGSDPNRPTTIEVRFSAQEDGTTKVTVEHGRWEHAPAELAEEHRACVAAPDGWSGILEGYRADVASRPRS
jgi:uncharacterized protein YndB with AHSA1/START domain